MPKRKARVEEERELTRKEIRLRARERERNRRLYVGVGIAIALALVLVIAGAVIQYAVRPNSAVATVGPDKIITRDFWKRLRFEKWQMEGQLVQMQQLQSQFGQQLFANQISQLQNTLGNPFALGMQVLDNMIDEKVIKQQTDAKGITVSDEEVEAALREEIANGRGAVSEPQATKTAEANTQATATAAGWTPTPAPTVDASSTITATATVFPTPEPPPARAIISATGYTEGVNQLTENLKQAGGFTLDDYRNVVRMRLLHDKLQEAVTAEKVSKTEEQVHARHILIAIREPTPAPTATLSTTATTPLTAAVPLTNPAGMGASTQVTGSAALTTAEPATAVPTTTVNLTTTAPVTASTSLTHNMALTASEQITNGKAPTTTQRATAVPTVGASAALTTSGEATASQEVAGASTVTASAGLSTTSALTTAPALTTTSSVSPTTPSDPNAPRTDAEALALAQEVRRRLLAGEDFATLAKEFSDDSSNANTGGDLGWFGKGRMVPEFDKAAFSLPLNQVSEPIKTQFGYHLIEVLEKDANRPKDEQQLQQERTQAFDTWLNEQKTATKIDRPQDLNSLIPDDIKSGTAVTQ